MLCWPEQPWCKFSVYKREKERGGLQLCQCWIKLCESSRCSCRTNGLACAELCLCTECKIMPADNLQFVMPEYGRDGNETDSNGVEDYGSEDELM